MRTRLLLVPLICGICFASHTAAETADPTAESLERDTTWHGRLGVGLNPVASRNDWLPKAHMGFGASVSGFVQLPLRLSAGANVDWERYTFDSNNHGDIGNPTPRYTDEVLMHTRLMALLQWDVLRHRFITPFVVAGAGYGWEHAELTAWQCIPKLMSGLVVGGGAGVDLAVHELLGVGIEYRANTLPLGVKTCTLALIDNEPLGTPSDFLSQRISITLSLRN